MKKKTFLSNAYLNCFIILFCSVMFTSYSIESKVIPEMKDSLIKKIEELKIESGAKGLLAGVWKGEQKVFSVALGESMTSVPAGEEMHFRIGGVSETFLGTLLMILTEKNMISLDDKISKWLPELLASDQVTVGMLIKNTAGYKDYVLNEKFVNLVTKEPFRKFTPDEIIAFATEDGELNFPPGTDQKYSHTEFTILGEVIKRAVKKSMYELYDEFIFNPLKLEHTGYCTDAELPYPVLHAFSKDRGVYEDATFWNPSWTGESGSLYSTLDDLGKWAHVFGTGKFLIPESFKILVSRYKDTGKPELYFASGFVVANGWYLQNPSFNGYSGAFGYFPGEELTLIVYTTESEVTAAGKNAFYIFKDLVKILTPDSQINF